MRGGQFTVGDFALFAGYIGWFTGLPRLIGYSLSNSCSSFSRYLMAVLTTVAWRRGGGRPRLAPVGFRAVHRVRPRVDPPGALVEELRKTEVEELWLRSR